jgi:hypothetical protein
MLTDKSGEVQMRTSGEIENVPFGPSRFRPRKQAAELLELSTSLPGHCSV